MAKLRKITCCLLIGMLLSYSVVVNAQSSKKESRHFRSNRFPDRELGYLVYNPKDFKTGKKYPLLVYLHGSGAIGIDLEVVKKGGIPFLIEEGMDLPFIVIAPQLPPAMNNLWPPNLVNEFILQASASYSIDANRIYLTGFSMGGNGVWDYACAYPSVIACAVPLSGWGNPQILCTMKNIPTWVFHGSDDKIVNPKGSRNLSNKLKSCGGDVTLTELAGVDHEAWRQAYSYPGLFDWIASRNRADSVRRKSPLKVNDHIEAYKLPKALYQVTGIACSDKSELYGITAKNMQPLIFNFDTLGHIKRMIRINHASNLSWQDLTYGDNEYLYIADVGNDGWKRKFFQIYKIKDGDLVNKLELDAEKIEFQLSDNIALNFKSIFFMSGQLYLFGETYSGEIQLVKVPDQAGSILTATNLGTISNLHTGSVMSTTFNSKTRKLYVLGKNKIEVIDLSAGEESIKSSATLIIKLPTESLKDGIALFPNNQLAFTDQNFLGTIDGNLYIMRQN